MPDLVVVLIIVLVVVLIWRGPKTLPSLGKAFGQGVKEARNEIDGIKSDKDDAAGTVQVTEVSVSGAPSTVPQVQPQPPAPLPPAPPAALPPAPPAPPAAPQPPAG